MGTTVKINPGHLQGARGLRIGIYPKTNARDTARQDDDLNLIRLPLPYDGAFMELFYKAFYLVKASSTPMRKSPLQWHSLMLRTGSSLRNSRLVVNFHFSRL